MPSPLPVDRVLPALLAALEAGSACVLRAPTGAGKTTRVPPAILDAGCAGGGRVVVLEPRRLAARAAARRIADERGVELGGEVGYHVRFDRRASARTRLLVATDGVVLRMLQEDPLLEGVGALVFDEVHERGLTGDLALALARSVQRDVRPDLKLVAMSATLDVERLAAFLGRCPVVESSGRLHPVDVRYAPPPAREPLEVSAAAAAAELFDEASGDVLVFLPGVGEIRRARERLAPRIERAGGRVDELYGDLASDRQDSVLRRSPVRRVVLATNVAETSVTVQGVDAVVDTGLVRRLRLDPGVGLDRLRVERVSRASADQRSGRAGRTAPGRCIRLWSEREHAGRAAHDEPEVLRIDVSGAVLQLLAFGERDVERFGWLEAPPPRALADALELLRRLGALEAGGLGATGRAMAELPLNPRLARLAIEGARAGIGERAALAAALLAERDPFRRGGGRRAARHGSPSDVLDRVGALEAWAGERGASSAGGAARRGPPARGGRRDRSRAVEPSRDAAVPFDELGARHVLRAADQLARLVRRSVQRRAGRASDGGLDPDEALLRAVLCAWPDRVARRRGEGSRRAVMVGGRGVRLADESAVDAAELFVCVDLDAGGSESLVRVASAVERAWLERSALGTDEELRFDPERERVIGLRRTRYLDLVLDAVEVRPTDADRVARELERAAAADLARALDPDAGPVRELRTRVACLREWMPELELPALDDAAVRGLLPELCAGADSFAALRRLPLHALLAGRLTARQLAALEREAPERIAVPSGSQLRLRYEEGRPPVLEVRIQELFGLRRTPRVAAGRVAVLLHLLGPNYRPQQVTDDLESFWERTYPVVRKELRRRYPKHAWPDDPLAAEPERRPRRRGRRT